MKTIRMSYRGWAFCFAINVAAAATAISMNEMLPLVGAIPGAILTGLVVLWGDPTK